MASRKTDWHILHKPTVALIFLECLNGLQNAIRQRHPAKKYTNAKDLIVKRSALNRHGQRAHR